RARIDLLPCTKRYVDIQRKHGLRSFEALRRYADDREWNSVQFYRAPDYRLLPSESLLPVTVTQNRDRRRARNAIILGGDRSTEDCIDSEHRKVASGDHITPASLRLTIGHEIEHRVLSRAGVGKDISAIAKVCVVQIRNFIGYLEGVVFCAEHYELMGIFHGQRTEQEGVYDAEDRAVHADAKRKRKHRNASESGALRQSAQSVTKVLKQTVHKLLKRFPLFAGSLRPLREFPFSQSAPRLAKTANPI